MSDEIKIVGLESGLGDVFACMFDDSGDVYDITGDNYEAFVLAQLDRYDITCIEAGVSGSYIGSVPAGITDAGRYFFQGYRGTPATPVITNFLGGAAIVWNGSAEVFVIDTAGAVVTNAASRTASKADVSGVTTLIDLREADRVIDTSGSPWVLELRHKVTKNVLLRQEMKNPSDVAISTLNDILGRLELE